jgi:hypothetical protein
VSIFSCFALQDSFSAVPSVPGPLFMFCTWGLIVGCAEGVKSSFHVLSSRTNFLRFQGRQAYFSELIYVSTEGVVSTFSCFALQDSFSTVPSVPGPLFMFCTWGLIVGCAEGVKSSFHVLNSRTNFLRFQGRQAYFSCFALRDMFWAVPKASGPVFIFCVHRLVLAVPRALGFK